MKPSTINQTSRHESMDAILQDVKTTILQTNEIERFAVFLREKTIRPRPYHLSHLFLWQEIHLSDRLRWIFTNSFKQVLVVCKESLHRVIRK